MKRKGEKINYFLIGAVVILLISSFLMPVVIGNKNILRIEKTKNKISKTNYKPISFKPKTKTTFIDLFTSTVHTDCEGVEKSTKVLFTQTKKIDVDNNQNTGENGNDVQIQYLLLPVIEQTDDFSIGISFILNMQRLNEDIKNKDFIAKMEIGNEYINIGFKSPKNPDNEIPKSVSTAFTLMFYLGDNTRGYRFSLDPSYDTNMQDKKIVLLTEFNTGERENIFQYELNPSVKLNSEVKSTLIGGKWHYSFDKISEWDSTATTTYTSVTQEETKTTKFIIDKLPDEISFALDFTPFSNNGGKLSYESQEYYDISLSVESNQMGVLKYATLDNTPKMITAEWKPSILNGYYNVNIESDGTTFTIQDDLVNPDKKFVLTNLEDIDFKTRWNLSNPGDLSIEKTNGLNANLELKLEEWTATIDSEFTAKNIKFDWDLDSSGYLKLDSFDEPITTTDISLMSEDIGFKTIGESLTADDFELYWTLWPPKDFDITSQGFLDFIDLTIDVFFEGSWYHIWPF